MIFSKGKMSYIQALKQLFIDYANCSGQIINPAKSIMYSGSIPSNILNYIDEMLVFNIGTLPFMYLGVPIFKGKPKSSYLQPIADKINLKFAS